MRFLASVGAALLVALAGLAPASEQSEIFTAVGLGALHESQVDEALTAFDRAVESDSEDVFARYYRAMARGRKGDYDGAIYDLEEVLRRRPKLDEAAFEVGILMLEQQWYALAGERLAQAEGVDRFAAQAAYYRGLAALGEGNWDEARAACERAMGRDPTLNVPARYCIGTAHANTARWTSAYDEFTAVTKLEPKSIYGQRSKAFLRTYRYHLGATLGFEYDTNVVLAPLDDAVKQGDVSNEEDGRYVLALGGAYIPWRSDRTELTLGYDFFQSLHIQLTDFDVQDFRPWLGIHSNLGRFRLGLDALYDYFRVGQESLLQQVTLVPSVVIAEREFGRTEMLYRHRRRDYLRSDLGVEEDVDRRRSVENNAWEITQFMYLGRPSRFLSLSYRFDREGPFSPGGPSRSGVCSRRLAYDGHEVEGGVGWTLPAEVYGSFAYAYRNERYDRTTQDSGAVCTLEPRRRDDDHRLYASLRRTVAPNLVLALTYLGMINNSTVSDFEYRRNVFGIALEWGF